MPAKVIRYLVSIQLLFFLRLFLVLRNQISWFKY
tara:strand:- start:1114 stop:1215 length:102 start_codon:yes stop_codon:yes gene_type:complete